jgi:hypothetical protein
MDAFFEGNFLKEVSLKLTSRTFKKGVINTNIVGG